MSNIPRHMYVLSKVYWEIVDALMKNKFHEKEAKIIAIKFFKQFSPLPREKSAENVVTKEKKVVIVAKGCTHENTWDEDGIRFTELVEIKGVNEKKMIKDIKSYKYICLAWILPKEVRVEYAEDTGLPIIKKSFNLKLTIEVEEND